jgi:hypothetical protein
MITCYDCRSFQSHLNHPTMWCFFSKDDFDIAPRIPRAKETKACNYAHDKISARLKGKND